MSKHEERLEEIRVAQIMAGEAAVMRRLADMGLAPRVHTAPQFQTDKGLQFYAKDSDGQWHYVNHAGTWQACPPPVS